MADGTARPGAGVLLSRAVRLRCPHCGSGGLLESWSEPKLRCPRCGLRTDRGEEDFFLGAMMFNLVLSEGALALVLVGTLVAAWPDVPWNALLYGGVALMVLAPFVFLPLSRTIWLAFDLMLRPLTREELEWHRRSTAGTFRPPEDR